MFLKYIWSNTLRGSILGTFLRIFNASLACFILYTYLKGK